MKKYKEFLVTAEPFNTDVISSIMWELDITGISEDEGCLHIFAEMESLLDQEKISEQLHKLQQENLIRTYRVEECVLDEKNWNEEWEKSLNIIHVTDNIVIKPSLKDYIKKNNEIIITIDPKMSFGTGEHQTTKLIIRLIEKYIKPGMRILDVGTGTGILSIAAVKLGASDAVGFDTDEWCFGNAKENSMINEVSDKIDVRLGDINVITESEFDMILANIQKNILIELAEAFSKKLHRGGIILLSGLLKEDEDDILIHYKHKGFRYIESRQMDEWVAVGFVKL